ncbi:MAG: hypothetical protein GF353_21345 [Candidatus Lokiarchaeota archaeon]|nr:hypothetical protein [Candidatus Lokiarchaeota archaeon]
MATEPLTIQVVLELMFISIGVVIFGLILNKILGLKSSKMKELRDKAKNLQERLRQAQILNDPQLMQELQAETMQLMKGMLKKQLLPMCIRCIIFLGIFAIISFFYGQYEWWFWVYFLWSLGFSLLSFGLTKLYRKLTGKDDKKKEFAQEIFGSISPAQQGGLGSLSSLGSQSRLEHKSDETETFPEYSKEDITPTKIERKDAWKDKIKNNKSNSQ